MSALYCEAQRSRCNAMQCNAMRCGSPPLEMITWITLGLLLRLGSIAQLQTSYRNYSTPAFPPG